MADTKAVKAGGLGSWDKPGPEPLRVDEREPRERETTISARVLKSVAVTMSYAEMDVLIGTFGRSYEELTAGERAVQAEFTAEVERVRF